MVLAGTRVMLVEDEGMVAINAERMLNSIGCEVVGLAARVPHAFEKLGTLSFDVAMLDINLGGSMAYTLASDLRLRGVPFIFATSYGADSLPADLRDVPLINKPYSAAQLSEALAAALKRKER